MDLKWSNLQLSATTNEQGQFEIHGLPHNFAATLLIQDERFINTELYAATSKKINPDLSYFHRLELHESGFNVTLQRGVTLQGQVLAENTKEPIPHATINGPNVIIRDRRRPRAYGNDILATTDERGRFVLRQQSSAPTSLRVTPSERSEYLGVVKNIRPKDSDITIKLPRGVVISGRVVDDVSGDGISGAIVISRLSQTINRSGRRIERSVRQTQIGLDIRETKTQDDGSFRFAVKPGTYVLSAYHPETQSIKVNRDALAEGAPDVVSQDHVQHSLTVKAGEPVGEIEFRLPPQQKFYGRVLDPDGQPVSGALIQVRTVGARSRVPQVSLQLITDENGKFELAALRKTVQQNHKIQAQLQGFQIKNRDGVPVRGQIVLNNGNMVIVRGGAIVPRPETRPKIEILAMHYERLIGSHTTLPLPKTNVQRYAVTIRLQPLTASASGKILDDVGQPIAGAVVSLRGATTMSPAVTDANGNYQFDHLISGGIYTVSAQAKDHLAPKSNRNSFTANSQHVQHQDLVLIRPDQLVSGIVLDRHGTPLPNVKVWGRFDGMKYRKISKKVLTDEKGHFTLTGLPPGQGTILVQMQSGLIFTKNDIEVGRHDVVLIEGKQKNPPKPQPANPIKNLLEKQRVPPLNPPKLEAKPDVF